MQALATLFSLIVATSKLFAHAGHGVHAGHSLPHYLLSWEHAIGLFVAIVLAIAGVKYFQTNRQKS